MKDRPERAHWQRLTGGRPLAIGAATALSLLVLAHPALVPRALVAVLVVVPLTLGAAWHVMRSDYGRSSQLHTGVFTLAALWIAALTGSALAHTGWSPDSLPALVPPVLSIAMLWVGSVLSRIRDGADGTDTKAIILIALVATCAVACLHGILQHLGADPLPRVDTFPQRVVGPFTNPNHLGGLTALVLPVALGGFLLGCRRAPRYAAAAVVMIYTGLLLAGSRGAMWAALAGCLVVFAAYLRRLKQLSRRPAWLRTGLLVLVLTAVTLVLQQRPIMQGPRGEVSVGQRLQAMSNVTGPAAAQDLTVVHRRVLWHSAWEIFLQHPLTGAGPGTYAAACARVLQDMAGDPQVVMLARLHRLEPLPYAHNELLHSLAEGGLVATLPWALLIAVAMTALLRRAWAGVDELSGMTLGLCSAVLVHSLVSYPMYLPATAACFWLVLGMSFIDPPEEHT